MSATSPSPTPDLTSRPWAAVASRPFVLTWLSTWLVFLGFYLQLPVMPGYLLQIGGNPSQVGWLMGLLTLSAMVCRPIAGKLADLKGKTWTMLFGAVLLVVTMTFYWVVGQAWSLLALRFFHGIGWAIYLTAAVALISQIAPPTQRATVTGHYFLANTLALVIGPWLGTMVLRNSSYPFLFTLSILLTAIAVLTIWPLHRQAEPHKQQAAVGWFCRRALLPSMVMFFCACTYGGILSFLPLYIEHCHVSNAGIFFSIYAISLGLFRPVAGYFADRHGRQVAILPGAVLLILTFLILPWMPDLTGIVTAAILYGIGWSAMGPALNAFLIDRVESRQIGAAVGMYTAAFELGIALGSVGLGQVLAFTHGNFRAMWLSATILPAIGFIVFWIGWKKSRVRAAV